MCAGTALLIVDNMRLLHAREPFTNAPGIKGRTLRRLWLFDTDATPTARSQARPPVTATGAALRAPWPPTGGTCPSPGIR